MKTVKISVYEYAELNEKAQQRVKERLLAFSECDGLSDYLTSLAEEKLDKAGYVRHHLKLYFGLGYLQGDGVAFDLKVTDKDGLTHFVTQSDGHYTHYNMSYITENEEGDDIETPSEFIAFVKELSRLLEKDGCEFIEWEQSDENIRETCAANEWFFYDNGDIFP